MSSLYSIRPFICAECAKSLSARRAQSLRLDSIRIPRVRQISTSTQRRQITEHADTSPSDTSKGDSKPERRYGTKIWTSLIKSRYLGRDARVLVLRDAERKRSKALELEAEDKPHGIKEERHVDADALLASIASSKRAPKAEELQQLIGDLYPLDSQTSPAGNPVLTQDQFYKLAERLKDSFTQSQLSAYIASKEGTSRPKNKPSPSAQKRAEKSSELLGLSDWIQRSSKNAKPTSSTEAIAGSSSRGKIPVVHTLMRSTWGCEIEEEIESPGDLVLTISSQKHMSWLLHGDDSSFLATLGRKYHCPIEVNKVAGSVNVIAPKYDALEVASHIDRAVSGLYELHIDLKPFLQNGRSLTDVLSFDFRSRHILEVDEHKLRAKVTAGSKHDAHAFQRVLVRASGHGKVDADYLVSNSSDDPHGTFWPFERFLLPSGQQMAGRLSGPVILSRGPSPTTVKPRDQLLESETMSRVWKMLEWNESEHQKLYTKYGSSSKAQPWSVQPQTEIRTKFGHIVHQSPIASQFATPSTVTVNQQEPLIDFRSETPGIPQLLATHAHSQVATQVESMRIQLIANPWYKQRKTGHQQFAKLELWIALDPKTRHVMVRRCFGILSERRVSVMIPGLATDLRFTRQDTLELLEPNSVPEIEAYVSELARSAVGFGSIIAPDTLDVPIPGTKSKASYFTISLEFRESLVFDIEGYDLVHSRSGMHNAKSKRDELSLCMRTGTVGERSIGSETPTPTSVTEYSEATDLTMPFTEDQEAHFGTAVNKVLLGLNLHIGREQILKAGGERRDKQMDEFPKEWLSEGETETSGVRIKE